MVIGGDRARNLGVCHSDFWIKLGKLQMLLVFFRAVSMTRASVRIRGSSPWSSLSLRGVSV